MFGDLRTRLRLAVAVAVTAAGLYWLVWYAVKPNVFGDPVSFIYNEGRILSWLLLAVVAVISTVSTVLICGRRLPHLPVLVFAAGLAVLSIRSGPAVRAQWSYEVRSAYLNFALETVLLTVALWVVHRLGKLLLARLVPAAQSDQPPKRQPSLMSFLPALGLAALVAFIVAFQVGPSARAIIAGAKTYMVYGSERGQVIFASWAAGFLSTLAAHQSFRPSRSIWCWLALPAVGVAGYLVLAGLGSPAGESLPINPLGNFLPIDFVGPGVLGGMMGLLLSHKLFRNRDMQEA